MLCKLHIIQFMKEELSDLRKIYQKGEINFNELKNPYNLFKIWFNKANEDKFVEEANAMVLSTIGKDGYPKGRVVLLKKIGPSLPLKLKI